MVSENFTTQFVPEILLEAGRIVKWLQAIGIIILLWIVFQIVTLIVNRKNRKIIYKIEKKLQIIEDKLDKLTRKK